MKYERFKNYGLWVSIFSFIPLLLHGLGINILPANYEQIVTAFLGILVMAGLLNNPNTNSKWYADDKELNGADKALEETPKSSDNVKESEKPKQ